MTHLTAELAYWITERESIRLKRTQGLPAPWSADPIFQTVRFCNVHREDDTVTQWMRQNWTTADDPAWRFVLGRLINLPSSLQHIVGLEDGTDMEFDLAQGVLEQLRKLGRKIFTSAYTISTCGQKLDKLDYVFNVVRAVKRYEDTFGVRYTSLAECANDLQNVAGLGSFLAGQVVADMKNTVDHPLRHVPDWWSWSAPGPGSLRGLNWYFYGGPTGKCTPATYQEHIAVLQKEMYPLVYQSIGMTNAQDWQNICCEFSKFCKVRMDPKAHVRNRVAYA